MFDWTPSLMSQIQMHQILGFGLDPLPPFGTMSLNLVFFYFEGVPKAEKKFCQWLQIHSIRFLSTPPNQLG